VIKVQGSARPRGGTVREGSLRSAPAERGGDGALDSDGPKQSKAVSCFACHRTPKVEIVFKDGVGYDSEKLIQSVQGLVGIR